MGMVREDNMSLTNTLRKHIIEKDVAKIAISLVIRILRNVLTEPPRDEETGLKLILRESVPYKGNNHCKDKEGLCSRKDAEPLWLVGDISGESRRQNRRSSGWFRLYSGLWLLQ